MSSKAPSSSIALPTITARRTLHHGRKFDYEQLTVRAPSGKEHTRELVRHPGAVVIVPLLETPKGRCLVLIRVYRASLDALAWECCAGTLEKDEHPALCAGRELVEETGYQARTVTELARFHTSPGLSTNSCTPSSPRISPTSAKTSRKTRTSRSTSSPPMKSSP